MSPAEEMGARYNAEARTRRRIERKAKSIAAMLRLALSRLSIDGDEGRIRSAAVRLLNRTF